ncbi:hypothetical protein [Acidisphaera rubrifaciens]|uniref:Cobalamin (Vitamin B12) biosynthesis protein precorrin-3B biosynthesis protein CobG n=1 Tax=Acidisphaera rubrifaciens HS-AP3 TaxID=1231350 RepID=A0A0D6P657_9PROT|nr:hypothetical protein [Acidisphaera rubrifaciens]GAN76826.1 cobalamin (vitamin B12) biosynthesis protein precorrin-3B biosynthesis protein CobG [Acidisphaera rubrifaciens HS-AP3]
MSARRGWCPDIHAPLEAGDGWLLRVKPPFGRLPPAMTDHICDVAARWGNGVIEVSSRGNLQLRGIAADRLDAARACLIACGAASPDPVEEAQRNLAVSPLAGIDATVHPATRWVAETTAACLRTPGLPAKLGVVVDGGGAFVLGRQAGGVTLSLRGEVCAIDAGDAAPPALVDALARAIAARLVVVRGEADRDAETTGAGLLSYGTGHALVLTPAFGQTDAAALRAIGGSVTLHLAPGRRMVIADATPALLRRARDAGFVTEPDDPRLRTTACAGAPRCASARQATHALANRLAGQIAGRLHVSGCAKGCGQPGRADVTLVGEDEGYALVRDGRAWDMPVLRSLTPDACVAALREGMR